MTLAAKTFWYALSGIAAIAMVIIALNGCASHSTKLNLPHFDTESADPNRK